MTRKSFLRILLKIVPHTIAVAIAVLSFLIYDRNATRAIEEAESDFPLLTRDQFLTEKVIEIYCPREVRCSTPPIFVILSGHKKKAINADESIDRSTTLMKLMSVGDSLVKESYNDTLFVYKKGKVTSFLIR